MPNDTQVDHSACSAHGCPMIPTNTRSTKGDDWMCFIHFAADAQDAALITAELNRLRWLVDIVRALRAVGRVKNWADVEESARKAISLAQRGDLQMRRDENLATWMIRLECVLADSCRAAVCL